MTNNNLNLINGHIITLNKDMPIANSLTIKNGIIHSLGNPNNDLLTINLKGAYVYPGFVDSHFHLKNFGKRSELIDLSGISTPEKVIPIIKQQASVQEPGTWIFGFGWDQNKWDTDEYPDNTLLDNCFQEHKVALTRIDGHAMWVNRVAIIKSDLTYEYLKNIQGGDIINNCILLDKSMDEVRKILPEDDKCSVKRWIKSALKSPIFFKS